MPTSEEIEIVANDACIAVPCQYEGDGDTTLIVGDYEDVPQDDLQVFDQMLLTPGKLLVCSDVAGEFLLTFPLQTAKTRIRIWTDGLDFPTRVVIGVG